MSDATQPTPTGPDADVVADGVAALTAFSGGANLVDATRLLALWRYNLDLTAAERAAILDHFADAPTVPAAEVIECPERCYGCGAHDFTGGRFIAAPRRVPMLYCRTCSADLTAEGTPVREVTR